MSNYRARLDACKKMLREFERTQDHAFRRGDSGIDWFQQSVRLAGALRSAIDLAHDGHVLLTDSRNLNRQLLEVIEDALKELGLTEHAAALRPALTDDPPQARP